MLTSYCVVSSFKGTLWRSPKKKESHGQRSWLNFWGIPLRLVLHFFWKLMRRSWWLDTHAFGPLTCTMKIYTWNFLSIDCIEYLPLSLVFSWHLFMQKKIDRILSLSLSLSLTQWVSQGASLAAVQDDHLEVVAEHCSWSPGHATQPGTGFCKFNKMNYPLGVCHWVIVREFFLSSLHFGFGACIRQCHLCQTVDFQVVSLCSSMSEHDFRRAWVASDVINAFTCCM